MPKATKHGRMVTYIDGVLPKKSHCILSLGLAKSFDKPKSYLHDHSFYGHQTQQNGGLPWAAPTHKITWPFSHMVLQDHVTN